jgi:Spy/CpxP family protein refolding chaperone
MTRHALGCLLAATVVSASAIGTATAAPASHDRTQSQQADGRHRHKWWNDDQIKAELALTAQQAQEIEQIFQASIQRLRTLKEQLDLLEKDLSRMIRERTSPEATVAQQLDRVETTRGELNKARMLMIYKMHRVLTSEQNEKLRAINDRRDRKDQDR